MPNLCSKVSSFLVVSTRVDENRPKRSFLRFMQYGEIFQIFLYRLACLRFPPNLMTDTLLSEF